MTSGVWKQTPKTSGRIVAKLIQSASRKVGSIPSQTLNSSRKLRVIGRTPKKQRKTPVQEEAERERQELRDVVPLVAVEPRRDERPDLVEDPGAGEHQPGDHADHEEDGHRLQRRERDQGAPAARTTPAPSGSSPTSSYWIGNSDRLVLRTPPLRATRATGASLRIASTKASAGMTASIVGERHSSVLGLLRADLGPLGVEARRAPPRAGSCILVMTRLPRLSGGMKVSDDARRTGRSRPG